MQDREINRKFEAFDKRLDLIENAKPGEPVLGSELDKTLRKIEGNTSDIKNDLGTLRERVDNHIKFFWAAFGVFSAILLATSGYILSQQGRLSRLEAALPTAQLANATSGTLNEQKIQKIERVVAEAKQTGARIEPEALSNVGRHLIKSSASADPKLADAAWNTIREMVAYRTTLNVTSLPLIGAPALPKRTTYYAFVDVKFDARPKVAVAGSVPRGQNAILEPIGSGMNNSLLIGDQYIIVSEGIAIIDGIEMKNVIFQNLKVVYHGGPIIMNNVYFVNCTFDLPQDLRGQNLALTLLQSPVTTFSVS